MSTEDKSVEERAASVRRDEGAAGDRGADGAAPDSPEGEEAEVVRANKAMKRQTSGGGVDPGVSAGLAAEGFRLNSTDRAKHSVPGGEDKPIDETGGDGPRGRYADG